MSAKNRSFFDHQAALCTRDELDALRKVLDPRDTRGVKNAYLDEYLKFYVRSFLRPTGDDTVLEIGCGIGRLTEYIAQFARSVYGLDIADGMIDACNANPRKRRNTAYLKMTETGLLRCVPIHAFYIVWVLTTLQAGHDEIARMLREYRGMLPDLRSAVVLEQVKRTYQEHADGECKSVYRTVEEYTEIFHAAGFTVAGHHVLAERNHGPLYRCIHILSRLLPRSLAVAAPQAFALDKFVMGKNGDDDMVNDARPTDVVFLLER